MDARDQPALKVTQEGFQHGATNTMSTSLGRDGPRELPFVADPIGTHDADCMPVNLGELHDAIGRFEPPLKPGIMFALDNDVNVTRCTPGFQVVPPAEKQVRIGFRSLSQL